MQIDGIVELLKKLEGVVESYPALTVALVAAKQWLEAADLFSARSQLPTEMRDEYKQKCLDAKSSFRAALTDLEDKLL